MESNQMSTVIAVIVLLGAGGVLWYLLQTPASLTPSSGITITTSSTTATSEPGTSDTTPVARGCDGCFSQEDNGKTVALAQASRISLILPNSYSKAALTLSPAGSLGETFGASAPAGMWVRTFETTSPGATSIVVPGANRNTAPYALTILTVDSAHAWESGMTVVRKEDTNQTITLSRNERFVLNLGSDLTWKVQFDPADSIIRVANSASTGGIQGVYEAAKTGTATLRATGAPICVKGQACPQFLINVTVTFDIR
jgi:hypothetical protein